MVGPGGFIPARPEVTLAGGVDLGKQVDNTCNVVLRKVRQPG